MKKIIGAFALASLALGLASADVKFTLQYRTQMIGFSRLIAAPNTNNAENVNYWFQHKAYGTPSDTVSMSASNDFAGVTVRIDPNLNGDAKGNTDSPDTGTINQYNGYIRFAGFELGAGSWKDGRYNSDYQLKKDSDDGFYGGETFAAYKLGSLYKSAITTAVDDMSNFAGGSNASSAYLQWKGNLGAAKVTAEVDLIGSGKDESWDEGGTIYTGFGARANFALDSWQTQFVFKTKSNKNNAEERALALYLNFTQLPVNLVVGGALGFKGGDLTEWNADLRLRKATGNMSLTFYTNVSHITNDASYTALGKTVGAIYVDDAGTLINNGNGNGNTKFGINGGFNTHMWNMFGLRLKFTDSLYFLFSAGDIVHLRDVFQDEWGGIQVFAAPGIQITNGKCGISAYARFGMSNIGVDNYNKNGSESELALLIPVVLRVRF